MVRGRRVRAVVACSRNDECCSPDPKRKDQGNVNGKLSHAILNTTNKTQSIAQFFQAVEVQIDEKNDVKDILLRNTDDNGDNCLEVQNFLNNEPSDLDDKTKEEFTDIVTTPSIKNSLKSVIEDILSPPTPHRIELCEDAEEKVDFSSKLENPISLPAKKVPASKVRRRLNNNQSANQQAVKVEKTVNNNNNNNNKLTDYFPVRRSARKTNKVVLEEKQKTLEDLLRKGIEVGLKIVNFEGKGRGVIANKTFNRGDFVVEYAGDLIDTAEARRREGKYAQDQNTGCYMYYFKHKGQPYCIDATAETGRLGRLVNHSRNGNLITRTIDVDNLPRLVLIAKDTIEIGEEVTYDYGDRSKESLLYHPWLAY